MINILQGEEARKKLKKGVDILADIVKSTLGPKGKVIVFERGTPLFSLDGVTVAKQITLDDPIENMGAQIVKGVANKVDNEAGDGTTTATILCQSLLTEGLKLKSAGLDMIKVKQGIEQARDSVLAYLDKIKKPIEDKDIKSIATIASRDTEIGEKVAEIVQKVGQDGVVTVDKSDLNDGIYTEIVSGMRFDSGFASPYFVNTPEKGECILNKALVVVTSESIKTNSQIMALLDEAIRSESKSLLLIAEDFSGEALATLILNHLKQRLSIVCVKAPGIGEQKMEQYRDIALVVKADFITEQKGMKIENLNPEWIGKAEKVIVDKENTTIVGGAGELLDIKARSGQIKLEIEKESSPYHKAQMKQRLAKLSGGVGIIRVGGSSDAEAYEKRYRIEDAVRSTQSAIAEGVVIGGGMALYNASKTIEPDKDISINAGIEALKRAIQEPARTILINGELSPDAILPNLTEGQVFNPNKNEVVNAVEAEIIDPVKVTRLALINSISAVSLFLITEGVISYKEDRKED